MGVGEHANAYHKLSGWTVLKKWNNLKLSLAQQQQIFTQVRESNENTTETSYGVAMLIAKEGKPFTFIDQKNVRRGR